MASTELDRNQTDFSGTVFNKDQMVGLARLLMRGLYEVRDQLLPCGLSPRELMPLFSLIDKKSEQIIQYAYLQDGPESPACDGNAPKFVAEVQACLARLEKWLDTQSGLASWEKPLLAEKAFGPLRRDLEEYFKQS